jgi:hypothetical protein
MKAGFAVGIVLVFLAGGLVSQARAETGTVVRVGVGSSFATNPKGFKDYWSLGLNGGIGFGVATRRVDLLVDADFSYFTAEIGSRDIHVLTIFGNARIRLAEARVAPYIKAGLGSFRIASGSGAEETALGANVGLGLLVRQEGGTGTVGVYVEGEYVTGFTEHESTAFLLFQVGLTLRFN